MHFNTVFILMILALASCASKNNAPQAKYALQISEQPLYASELYKYQTDKAIEKVEPLPKLYLGVNYAQAKQILEKNNCKHTIDNKHCATFEGANFYNSKKNIIKLHLHNDSLLALDCNGDVASDEELDKLIAQFTKQYGKPQMEHLAAKPADVSQLFWKKDNLFLLLDFFQTNESSYIHYNLSFSDCSLSPQYPNAMTSTGKLYTQDCQKATKAKEEEVNKTIAKKEKERKKQEAIFSRPARSSSGSVQCSGYTKSGRRCRNVTKSASGRCHLH